MNVLGARERWTETITNMVVHVGPTTLETRFGDNSNDVFFCVIFFHLEIPVFQSINLANYIT